MGMVILTDLDNTLLDEKYSFEPALPVIEALKKDDVPIIFATSKTVGETLYFQKAMGISDPFVVENGGAGYIPRVFFERQGREPFFSSEFLEIPLGVEFPILLDFMDEFRRNHGGNFIFLHSLSLDRISHLTGLPPHLAELARIRDWDLAFLVENENIIPTLKKEAEKRNLRLQKGGIFYHLTGKHSKATAIELILREAGLEKSVKIALGDSYNDLEMLKAADIPILVSATPQKADRMREQIPNLKIYFEKGPQGWRKALQEVFEEIEGGEKWRIFIRQE